MRNASILARDLVTGLAAKAGGDVEAHTTLALPHSSTASGRLHGEVAGTWGQY